MKPIRTITKDNVKNARDYCDFGTIPSGINYAYCDIDKNEYNSPLVNCRLLFSRLNGEYFRGEISASTQIAIDQAEGAILFRSGWNSKYSNWLSIDKYHEHTLVFPKKIIDEKSNLLFLGDSLWTTIGGGICVPEIIKDYMSCHIINKSLHGTRFDESIERNIIKQISSEEVKKSTHIFIICGTNDALHKTDLDHYRKCIINTIDNIYTIKKDAYITVITPPPKITYAEVQIYSAILAQCAVIKGCNLISGYDIPLVPSHHYRYLESNTSDGIHPDATGKEIIARYILQFFC